MRAGACTSVDSTFICEILQPEWKICQRIVRILLVIYPGIPAPISWWPVRHFDLTLNLRMSVIQPCFQGPELVTLERQEVRNCPSCNLYSSHFWSIVALDRWPTHKSIRGLCKACQYLHGYELIQVMNEHLCLLVGVHFTISSQYHSTFPMCPSLLSLIFLLIMRIFSK